MQKRVLLVDDELLIRLWLAEEFATAGYDVAEAEDGDMAMALMARSEAFDLLITDIDMPGVADGNALATWAKERYPGLPVIYASGRPTSLRNAVTVCDRFVAKPFSAAMLLTIAQGLLAGGRDKPSVAA